MQFFEAAKYFVVISTHTLERSAQQSMRIFHFFACICVESSLSAMANKQQSHRVSIPAKRCTRALNYNSSSLRSAQRGMKCAKVRSYTGEYGGSLLFSPGEKYNFGNCLAGCPRAYKRNSPERHKTTAQQEPLFFFHLPTPAAGSRPHLQSAPTGQRAFECELRCSHALLNLFTSNGPAWRLATSLPPRTPLFVLALVFLRTPPWRVNYSSREKLKMGDFAATSAFCTAARDSGWERHMLASKPRFVYTYSDT